MPLEARPVKQAVPWPAVEKDRRIRSRRQFHLGGFSERPANLVSPATE
jgi:hypothetical protein